MTVRDKVLAYTITIILSGEKATFRKNASPVRLVSSDIILQSKYDAFVKKFCYCNAIISIPRFVAQEF